MTRALKLRVPEREFQAAVIDLAHTLRWRVVHFRPARNERGDWRTPVAGDAKGWPDITCVRDRLFVCELKALGGALSPDQREWVRALRVAGVEVYVWTPSDWDEIVATFTRRDVQ